MNGMYPDKKPTDNAPRYSYNDSSPLGSLLHEMDRIQKLQARRHQQIMLLITAWIVVAALLAGVLAFW